MSGGAAFKAKPEKKLVTLLLTAVVKVFFFYTFTTSYKALSAMIRGSIFRELVNGIGGDSVCDKLIKRQSTLIRCWFHEGAEYFMNHLWKHGTDGSKLSAAQTTTFLSRAFNNSISFQSSWAKTLIQVYIKAWGSSQHLDQKKRRQMIDEALRKALDEAGNPDPLLVPLSVNFGHNKRALTAHRAAKGLFYRG
ncbi:hypothetical protein EAE99_008014 [Botrytis elliptica]|nr:hypothetical protein EAE99_008014 [Botrytis elliptica]